jgi:Fibronectin type III domain
MADANGEVVTTTGAPYQGWAPWTSVSQGSTLPGAPVAAVPWEGSFALFLSDPNGGIYGIKAIPGFGWEAVPGRLSKPGASITALASGEQFTLFMADANGEVVTTTGAPYQGWAPWTSVSQGSTLPGAPVAAVPWEGSFALFLSDPNGGIYGIKAVPGFGWEAVPGRFSKPGAPITALRWFEPPISDPDFANIPVLLLTTDVNGEIVATGGLPYQGWQPWASVSDGTSIPGAAVGVVSFSGNAPFSLFAADAEGEVRSATSAAPPAMPVLAVTGVTQQTISLSWSETNPTSVELTGFLLAITKMVGSQGTTNIVKHGPTDRSATFSGLDSGTTYTFSLTAFSDDGYSPLATAAATTPASATAATLFAGITNLAEGNFGLLIRGFNFGKGEQVTITVDWTVPPDPPAAFPLLANTDPVVGGFQTTFTGVVPQGFCPISVPFGDPQPPQTFQVAAIGSTSGKTASTTAGPFTCP